MKKAFLKSPVAYARISSRFSLDRFHPILKIHRAHKGTDYAAPCGTPIRAVADGRIEAARYAGGNGNFVKIKHDKTYETQYLHMSRFGPGIRSGVMVKQGQTIGYVGQTGLATGCHVCFRFWKNGRQVDPLHEKMPPPHVMDPSQLPGYIEYSKGIKALLDNIKIGAPPTDQAKVNPAPYPA
jgi:murein DD-endopeptidase MepM/ murein hydrolase activator NlpD